MVRRASEVMTSHLIKIGWNESVKHAYDLMQKHRVRHLPVIDDEWNIIGILSDRDMQRAMKSELQWEEEIQAKVPAFWSVEFDPDAKVRHYMSWPVKSVDRKTDLRQVTGMMVTDKISAVLVMQGDHAVGIVTTEDLLKAYMGLLGNSPQSPHLQIDSVLPTDHLHARPST